jgi:preprotein translocase subunit SecE
VNLLQSLKAFFQDVNAEFRRVSWPTRQATLQSTGVVLVVTMAVAVFLGVVDTGLAWAIKQIIR